MPVARGGEQALFVGAEAEGRFLDEELLEVRQELVQGRVEQAHGDVQSVHRLEDAEKVLALDFQQALQRALVVGVVVGEDHLAHHRQAVGTQEHVLGAAEPNALRAAFARGPGVGGRVGVGPHRQMSRPHLVGPSEQRRHLRRRGVTGEGNPSPHHGAGRAFEGQPVALGDDLGPHPGAVAVEDELARPDDGRNSPAARHDGRVTHQAAARGHDPLADQETRDVIGRGLGAHQDHRFTARVRGHRGLGAEVGPTDGRAGRRGQARGEDLVARVGREARVQDLGEVVGRDARHRFFAGQGDALVGDHVDRDA